MGDVKAVHGIFPREESRVLWRLGHCWGECWAYLDQVCITGSSMEVRGGEAL